MTFIRRFSLYLSAFKSNVFLVVIFHLLTAVFTVVSIPMIIPFFQILFDANPEVASGNIEPGLLGNIESYINECLLESSKQTVLMYVCFAIIAIFLLKNIFRYLAMYFMTPVRNGIIHKIRSDIYEKIQSMPISFYQDTKRGNILSIVSNDVQEVEWSIVNTLEAFFKSPLIILGSIFFMLVISPSLTGFVLVLLLITVFVIGGISRTLKQKSGLAQSSLGKLLSTVDETLYGYKVMKMYNSDDYFKLKFDKQNTDYKNTINRVLWRRDLSSPLSEFLGIVVVTVLLWYGSNQVFSEQLSPAVFFAFIFAFYQVIEPAKSFSTAYYNVQKGLGALDRIDGFLEVECSPTTHLEDLSIGTFNSIIEFRDVSFKYEKDVVIDNINFTIKKGEKLAIIGPSGSGKTTLIDLLLGFYKVDKGSILIDGKDINNFSSKSLRSLFGVVNQHPILFHDDILTNISMSDDYDLSRIKEAADRADASTFIENLDKAYETIIGTEGMKLSGGERQRICLARAIYKDAQIVVLDEATSSVDAETEYKIHKALNHYLQDKTAIIIAHKLTTIQNADKIILLENGRIIDQGTHNELLKGADAEHYQRMVELQIV